MLITCLGNAPKDLLNWWLSTRLQWTSAFAMELLKSCTKPSKYLCLVWLPYMYYTRQAQWWSGSRSVFVCIHACGTWKVNSDGHPGIDGCLSCRDSRWPPTLSGPLHGLTWTHIAHWDTTRQTIYAWGKRWQVRSVDNPTGRSSVL